MAVPRGLALSRNHYRTQKTGTVNNLIADRGTFRETVPVLSATLYTGGEHG